MLFLCFGCPFRTIHCQLVLAVTCTCNHGSPATGPACDTDGTNLCASCWSGFALQGTACLGTFWHVASLSLDVHSLAHSQHHMLIRGRRAYHPAGNQETDQEAVAHQETGSCHRLVERALLLVICVAIDIHGLVLCSQL